MNIAQAIIESIRVANPQAVSLEYGYMQIGNARRVAFDPAHVVSRTTNGAGRCTMMLARYADGSQIRFTWSDQDGPKWRAHA